MADTSGMPAARVTITSQDGAGRPLATPPSVAASWGASVPVREQLLRIVAKWRRDLPAVEVQARAAGLREAIQGDMARGADPAEGLEALSVLSEQGL